MTVLRNMLKTLNMVLTKVKDPLTTKPATLFEFRTADDLGMWKTFADSVFGGKSSAMLEHSGPLQNFASFRGVYSREIGEKASPRLKRSGFVGMTGRYNGLYIDLESYQSVVYRVRGDGRAYLANIRTDNWVVGDTAEDIWQAVLLSSGNENKENNGWQDVEVPLDAFVLTWRGKVVEQPVEMNRTKVTGMGISLLGNDEQKEGPYNLDIEWIKARHFSDGAPGMPLGGEKYTSSHRFDR